jgi:p38 MAP kinase
MLIVIASSARDQINHKTVAVKKLCEPFKTNNIAKHIFREVKLLKQFQHDNVCRPVAFLDNRILTIIQIIRLNDIFISPSEEM